MVIYRIFFARTPVWGIFGVIVNIVRIVLLILLPFVLSSCGYIYGDDGLIRSQKYDYVQAKQTAALKMPESLNHKSSANYTLVPNIGAQGSKGPVGKELTQAAPIQLLAVMDNTRVDKKSNVPAVLIVDKLEFIWQTAVLFFEEHQINTAILDRDNRTIVSGWLPISDGGVWLGLDGSEDTDLIRAKYRVAISDGEIKGEKKLTVERLESQFREDDDQDWKNKPATWQESADMMNLMLSYYDTRIRVQQAKHQLKVLAGFKVELGQDTEGEASLITEASENLIWQKIPTVMDELGLKVIDRDFRQKTYFLELEEVEEGFFANLFDEEKSKLPLEAGAYQLVLSEKGTQRALTFKDGQGDALAADILVKLYPELSRLFGDRR